MMEFVVLVDPKDNKRHRVQFQAIHRVDFQPYTKGHSCHEYVAGKYLMWDLQSRGYPKSSLHSEGYQTL